MPSQWQEWPHQGQILQREASQAQGNSDLWRACLHDKECSSQFRQIRYDLQPYLLGKEGMGKEGWDHSPLEGE
jgi:hypothetical protein